MVRMRGQAWGTRPIRPERRSARLNSRAAHRVRRGWVIALIGGAAGFGWDIERPDPDGVVRARTKTGQWRVWVIPRARVQHITNEELGGGAAHPGLYILMDDLGHRAYVGEAGDLRARLSQHLKTSPKELKEFQRVYILNDGRNFVHSYFTDATLRKALEQRVIKLLKDRGDTALANTVDSAPDLSLSQRSIFSYLSDELGFVLYELEVIGELPPPPIDRSEISSEELPSRFPGHNFKVVSAYEGVVDGEPAILTSGSDKPQGFQLTIRTTERWRTLLQGGKGYVCFLRGPCYMIPIVDLNRWLGEKLSGQTVDVFLDLEHEVLKTGGDFEDLSVTAYRGAKAPSVA